MDMLDPNVVAKVIDGMTVTVRLSQAVSAGEGLTLSPDDCLSLSMLIYTLSQGVRSQGGVEQ